jgi:transposase
MGTTEIEMPCNVFKFSGQTGLDTFSLDLGRYDDRAVNGLRLAMEAIRRHADGFPFWQRRRRFWRPSAEERTLLIAFFIQQLMDLTFRETEGMLGMVGEYYAIGEIPDHSTICRKLSSKRWRVLLERFFARLVESLPERKAIVATDATGYSGRKRGWNETAHAAKARQDWVKVHAAVEVDEFVVLSYGLTKSDVHESRMFEEVWRKLPDNVRPVRSLADSAYFGNGCLAAARHRGATPLHKIRSNARDFREPETFYQRLASFARHWPHRFAALTAKRNHVETVFSMIGSALGYRLRCRNRKSRENEVRCKLSLFNLIQLAMRREFWC